MEEHVNTWIDGIFHGICQFVVVAGTEESGKKYLIRGSNSTPGIIPFLEKRLATLGAELALTSKVSYLRYYKRIVISISLRIDTFWDILNPNRSSVSLQSSNDIYSFPSVKSVHISSILLYVASSLWHEECEWSRDHHSFFSPFDLSRHHRSFSLDIHCIVPLSTVLTSVVLVRLLSISPFFSQSSICPSTVSLLYSLHPQTKPTSKSSKRSVSFSSSLSRFPTF